MNDRKKIILRLEKQLEDTAGVRFLANPQSLFVIDNPDILATCGNRIFGIYIPTQFELNNIDSLYRRIYLSRLVYAHDMRIILVMDDYETFQKSSQIKYAIHRLAVAEEIGQVASIVESDNSSLSKRMLSRAVRSHAANNYYLYEMLLSKIQYSVGQKYEKLHREDWVDASPVTRWSDYKKVKSLKDTFEAEEAIVFNRKKNKSSIKQNLDSILNYVLFRQYMCDEGQLLINSNEKKLRILNTDMFTSLNLDSIGISTLSYLGILPVYIGNMSQFNNIYSMGLDLFEKKYGK
ncbi:hypothetical protein [Parabacteroides goldsteinii]|uniref:hypothetical protein n=1 Tax=Parabacteroides goldsteinii TaxID=328812 RepID=UPI002676090E|nr:hypothetical protein [Parabacteroides goldsteinii]